ncbi:MAG: hypothetical protein IJM15_06195 [Erysipelotrichaceae bacterium]|nr:hypothetical protein [Erysipelotrichaceae bacterium]
MAFAELTMRSTVLRMDVKVSVIIPENRRDYTKNDPDKKYKSLYVLHGTSEDNSTWLNSSNLYLFARDLDLFVFFPSGYNMCYVDTKFGFLMHTYLTEELPARMAQIFPISTKREDTFIMGESMGGYGTLYTSLMRPDLYGKAVVLSSIGFRNIKHVYDTGASSVDQMMKEKYDAGVQFPEYLAMCGTDDGIYTGAEGAPVWAKWVHENCPNVVYKEEYWPGKHDFFFWNQAIPKALDFFGFKLDPERVKQI